MTRRSRSIGLGSWLVLSLQAGCLSFDPQVPAYEPRSSDDAPRWLATRTETSDSRSLGRLEVLEAEADELRRRTVDDLLERLDREEERTSTFDLRALADLRRAGLPPELDAKVGRLLDAGIAEWTREADEATAASDLRRAALAWRAVSFAAADGRHASLEMKASDRSSRLLAIVAADDEDLVPPRAIAYTLRMVLRDHVMELAIEDLLASGFEALRLSAGSDGRSFVDELEAGFDPGGLVPPAGGRVLERETRRALDALGERLRTASTEDRFGEDRDGVRIFLEGTLAATDARTRVYYGDDAETVRRLFTDTYMGIGVEIGAVPEGIELEPLAGGPARRAGIRSGDLLHEIDGASVEHVDVAEVVARIAGRAGTAVELTVVRRGIDGVSSTLRIPVVRGKVKRETLHGWRQVGHDRLGRPIWDWVVEPESGIAYIAIREFVDDTGRRFRQALVAAARELSSVPGGADRVEGLVIDLRDNGGGMRTATEEILDLFLSDGPLFATTADRAEASPGNTRLEGMPVVVLVDEGSASASEMLAGTLQSRTGALVVGERTFGKGSVQQVTAVPYGFIVVTESWFLVPNGDGTSRKIDRQQVPEEWGVAPDLAAVATDTETAMFLEERGGWRSGLGRDTFDPSQVPSLESTRDRPLLEAILQLQAVVEPPDGESISDLRPTSR